MITADIETNGLLDDEYVNYTTSPYTLKPNYKMHCIVVEVHETSEIIAFYNGDTYKLDGRPYSEFVEGYLFELENYAPIEYTHYQLSEFPEYIANHPEDKVVGHNFIEFDILALKLWFGMDYDIRDGIWNGAKLKIEDTLVISKCLNSDRFGGHSLDNLGKRVGLNKIEFRKEHPKAIRFEYFAADMLHYCIRDVQVNTKVYKYLMEEKGSWNWEPALELEHRVKDITTRGSHRGFKFNRGLAEENLQKLDELMEERRGVVTPLIPPKPATKKFLKEVTPPKQQTKDKGKEVSANLQKFVAKHGGKLNKIDDFGVAEVDYNVEIFGKVYDLPLPSEPLLTTQEACIDDTTHIKEWMVSMGWEPSEYKEKDLTYRTVKGVGKVKRTQEEYNKAVETYVAQTLGSNFCKDRLEYLKTGKSNIKAMLLKKDVKRSVKVLTNPSFTVGQDKEMCPNLERVSEKFPHAKSIVEYLTYKHRRNSILGGGLDWEDEEEADKGYLAYVREDGRISTPADSCGAATSRYKHKVVANIPRVTSLFGKEMRGLFGVSGDYYQVGYDFSSLEARIEGHYCYRYDAPDKAYCISLTLEKPNDVHSVMARKISEIIAKEFQRAPAKSVKYGVTYGATEGKVAKTIGSDLSTGKLVYDAFWEAAFPLKQLKDKLKTYWENVGGKKFILGIDGRKVPTRSAHAILNSLFQSAGVICAKKTMVIYEDMLRERGLLVDFFKEDWKGKVFVQQLIAYHDEAQLETNKSEVKFKVFPYKCEESEKQAKVAAEEWKKVVEEESDEIWSEPTKSAKAWYVAYCVAGDLVSRAVNETSKHFNLNIPLGAEYIVGRDWAECH